VSNNFKEKIMSLPQERRNHITSRVVELTAHQAEVEPGHITPATHFVNDLNFDSLTMIELTMAVEDEFEVTVPDEAHDRLKTVGQVVEYLDDQLSAGDSNPHSPSDADPPPA
jgi:acyl carrier protein